MKNYTKGIDVFEFKEEEQPPEMEANKFCSNYTVARNGAGGTNENSKGTVDVLSEDGDGTVGGTIKNLKETVDELSEDVDGADGDFNRGMDASSKGTVDELSEDVDGADGDTKGATNANSKETVDELSEDIDGADGDFNGGTNENSKGAVDELSEDVDGADGDFNGGTNENSKETADELSEFDGANFDGNSAHSSPDCRDEGMLRLSSIPRSAAPNNRRGGSFLEGSSYTGTAFAEIFSQSHSSDESVGTVSDDESMSEQSASYSSGTPDHHGILDEPVTDHDCDHWGMFENGPIVFRPDYLYYRSYTVTDATVTLSSNCVEIKGSAVDGNSETSSFRFEVEDILQIRCHLSRRFDVAVFKIHVNGGSTAQAGNVQETSVIEEVEFSVYDFDLSGKCEAIESLDGYNAVWTLHCGNEEWRENSHGETSNQRPKKYFPSYSEALEELIYPKGEPDAVCISKRDFDLLAPDTFVNDTIIDFYIKYLKNGIPLEKRQRYHFFNSFFFRKLADMDKDPTSAFDGHAAFLRVRKWTRKVDLFQKDFVFIPVNYNYHWSLIVICYPGEVANFTDDAAATSSVKLPCILHMDSLRGSHAGLKDLLQSYLMEEWKERTKEASEVVNSKFRNLRFLSLELPQQQNLSDCGLFLLQYVERFLEEDLAGISPYRIKNYHNEFLSINWFQPYEPSIKRSAIQRLISDLLQNLPLENSPSCANDRCYPRDDFKTSYDSENAVELVSEQFASSKSSENLPCSQANEITRCPNSYLGIVCASESSVVLSDSFEPESDDEQLLDMRSSHSASFNEFGSSLPPIQEAVVGGVHLGYTSTETGLRRLGGNTSEPCVFPCSSGSLTAETSWIPGLSVVQDVDNDLSRTTSLCDVENPLDVDVGEELCVVDGNMSSDGKIDQPRSASAKNIDCSVDGHATSSELLDITLAQCSGHEDLCDKSSLDYKNLLLMGNGSGAVEDLLIGNGSGALEDPQPNAKRMRLTSLDDEELAIRSSLSNDLHL